MASDAAPDDGGVAGALRAAGLTVTAPRYALYRVLAGRERPASAAEVFDLLRAQGSRLGLTSVHRVLHCFAAADIAHVFPGPPQRFRLCARAPHAHLVCEGCGRVIEQPAEAVRGWLAATRRDADFVARAEHCDVYGWCGRCWPEAGPPAVEGTVYRI